MVVWRRVVVFGRERSYLKLFLSVAAAIVNVCTDQ